MEFIFTRKTAQAVLLIKSPCFTWSGIHVKIYMVEVNHQLDTSLVIGLLISWPDIQHDSKHYNMTQSLLKSLLYSRLHCSNWVLLHCSSVDRLICLFFLTEPNKFKFSENLYYINRSVYNVCINAGGGCCFQSQYYTGTETDAPDVRPSTWIHSKNKCPAVCLNRKFFLLFIISSLRLHNHPPPSQKKKKCRLMSSSSSVS